jgi:hypothetical protein
VLASHVVSCRSPTTQVGSYFLLAAFMRRHPWNFQVNFQVKRPLHFLADAVIFIFLAMAALAAA